MLPRALLFDFGGTLDADGVPWKDRFYELFSAEGLAVDRERFDRAFYDSDDPIVDRADAGATYEGTVHELASTLARRLGRPDVARRVAERFLAASRRKILENLQVLRRLARRYRIGVVSNFYGNLQAALRETGLDSVVEVAADSARVGVTKPDGRIFQCALDQLGLDADEVVMVGDSVPRDVEGARRLGMPFLLLLRADQPSVPEGVSPDRVIRSLAEIEGALR